MEMIYDKTVNPFWVVALYLTALQDERDNRMTMTNEFRPLNDSEKKAILISAKRGRIPADHDIVSQIDSLTVSYENQQGGFCVCIVACNWGDTGGNVVQLWRGASRRSYKDRRNQLKGQMIAFHRATHYSRQVEV